METKRLSRRAIKLLHRLYEGQWYRDPPNAAMQELIDADLVKLMGRVNVVSAAYVPVDTKPLQCERIPKKPDWLLKEPK